jgi:hypothetical protein
VKTTDDLAEALDQAVGLVLNEFLANAPSQKDARLAVQLAFLFTGMRSIIMDRGHFETASILGEGFEKMTGRELDGAIWGRDTVLGQLH